MPNSLTNSGCSVSGNVNNVSVTGYLPSGPYSATVTMTLDNGATVIFTGSPSANNNAFSGTFASTGSCMGGDSGTFTATLFSAVNGSYTGSFESSTGGPSATVQMNLATDDNFNVTGTVAPVAGANVCFSTMTVASLTAKAYGPSVASGDVLEAFASDNAGNVVAFLLSNTDQAGRVLANGGLYVTYFGIAGACEGISGTDVPFRKTLRGMRPRRPVKPRRVAKHSPMRPPDFRRWERIKAPVVRRPVPHHPAAASALDDNSIQRRTADPKSR
jgi:hypothetical protein